MHVAGSSIQLWCVCKQHRQAHNATYSRLRRHAHHAHGPPWQDWYLDPAAPPEDYVWYLRRVQGRGVNHMEHVATALTAMS